MSSKTSSSDDCYFFYYSTCTKGSDCPYRHCDVALGSETTCTHWRDGNCNRPMQCKYRHMECRMNRSSIQCWFETQPTGCRKPHCVFLHKKPRTLALDDDQSPADGIIRPVTVGGADTNTTDQISNDNNGLAANPSNVTPNATSIGVKRGEDVSKMKLFDDSDYLCQTLSSSQVSATNESTINHNINIKPISISLDCDEDNDSDIDDGSEPLSASVNSFGKSSANNSYLDGNYGVKTLEQIRMEKVFNSECEQMSVNDNNQCFPKNESQLSSPKTLKTNTDLRVRIRRQIADDNNTKTSASGLNTFAANASPKSSNFAVKTLDQLRQERLQAKGLDANGQPMNGLKENQEPRGEKRESNECNKSVVKIRRIRTSDDVSLALKSPQPQTGSTSDSVHQSMVTTCEQSLTTCETSDTNIVSSSDIPSKQRIQSVDTDLDDFDFLDCESTNQLDSNEDNVIDDEDDDELMREINQVINS